MISKTENLGFGYSNARNDGQIEIILGDRKNYYRITKKLRKKYNLNIKFGRTPKIKKTDNGIIIYGLNIRETRHITGAQKPSYYSERYNKAIPQVIIDGYYHRYGVNFIVYQWLKYYTNYNWQQFINFLKAKKRSVYDLFNWDSKQYVTITREELQYMILDLMKLKDRKGRHIFNQTLLANELIRLRSVKDRMLPPLYEDFERDKPVYMRPLKQIERNDNDSKDIDEIRAIDKNNLYELMSSNGSEENNSKYLENSYIEIKQEKKKAYQMKIEDLFPTSSINVEKSKMQEKKIKILPALPNKKSNIIPQQIFNISSSNYMENKLRRFFEIINKIKNLIEEQNTPIIDRFGNEYRINNLNKIKALISEIPIEFIQLDEENNINIFEVFFKYYYPNLAKLYNKLNTFSHDIKVKTLYKFEMGDYEYDIKEDIINLIPSELLN